MVISHLEVAARDGMKAGFNTYMEQLQRSGLPQVRAKLAELLALPKRERFARYCATVGPDVTAMQTQRTFSAHNPGQGTTITLPTEWQTIESPLAKQIAEARERLAKLEAQAKAQAPKPRTSKPKADAKENLWREWAVRKHSIPTKVGATFAYKGKRRTSTFKVTRVTSEGVYSVRVK
ncbi:MAG: hypothetical protein KGL39_15205 [Patescibacteria group bacterium]|nr:hypothetical protein [Patescibacteria group bacterium]